MREYKGWLISEKNVYGMWSAWKGGELRLAADTLVGMKQAITEKEKN